MIISPISLTVLMRFAHKTDNNARLSPSAQVEAFGLNARPHVALLFQFEKANPNKRDTK